MKIKNNGQVNNNTYDVFILTDVGLGKSVKLTTTTYPIQQRLDGGGKEMNTLEKLRSVLQKRLEDGTPTHITIRVGVVENNIELLMVSCALSPSSRVCYISKSLEQEDKFYSLTEDMDVSSCLAIINLCMEMFPYQTTGALVLPKSLTGMRELFRLANVLTILG